MDLFVAMPAITADGTLSFALAADAIGSTTWSVTLLDDGEGSACAGNSNSSGGFEIEIVILA
eukprot:3295929-Rhodomonas_salina.1